MRSLNPQLPFLLCLTSDILEDFIHLLQCVTVRLRHEEGCEYKREKTKDSEEGIGSISSILY